MNKYVNFIFAPQSAVSSVDSQEDVTDVTGFLLWIRVCTVKSCVTDVRMFWVFNVLVLCIIMLQH